MPCPLSDNTKGLLAFCATPRTMAVIQHHFNNEPWVKATVQNCVQRGKLFNYKRRTHRVITGLYCTQPEPTAMERYWGNTKEGSTAPRWRTRHGESAADDLHTEPRA